VSLSALYDKLNRTDPELGRALVQQSAERLAPVVEQLRSGQTPVCAGYRVRIVDGNCLAPSEKRLQPLRKVRSAALPGRSLVVYDPDKCLVMDVLPSEDGHAGERTLMAALVPTAQPGDLWLGDRNFCTYNILAAWVSRRCFFLVREHGSNAKLTFCGEPQERGKTETGLVYEHLVDCHSPDGTSIRLRRIEVHLHKPTEDGDTVVSLLTNLPETVTAVQIAEVYRRRWTIESMFQKLESVLASEIRTLGYPRAALFSFCVAILAHNVLSMLKAAVEAKHGIEHCSPTELSLYFVAAEVKAIHAGMMIAVSVEGWQLLRELELSGYCDLLLQIAANVDPTALEKTTRGPKQRVKKKPVPPSLAGTHVATARILDTPRRRP
jgi:IS4 transposase